MQTDSRNNYSGSDEEKLSPETEEFVSLISDLFLKQVDAENREKKKLNKQNNNKN